MSEDETDSTLKSLLAAEGLWRRRSSEGANGLFRAASVCLYFTEQYHEVIRSLVQSFFQNQWRPQLDDSKAKAAERYLDNMLLPEFEALNLEIVGRLFEVCPVVLQPDQGRLQRHSHGNPSLPTILLLRFGEGNYSALFSQNQHESFVLSQNLVMNLVEDVLQGVPGPVRDLNRGVLLNFDFERWLARSQPLLNSSASFRTLFEQQKFGSPSEKTADLPLSSDTPFPNVGTQIVTLLRSRKSSPQHTPAFPHPLHSFIANNFADHKIFLKSTPRCPVHRRSHSQGLAERDSPLLASRHELAGEWRWPASHLPPEQQELGQEIDLKEPKEDKFISDEHFLEDGLESEAQDQLDPLLQPSESPGCMSVDPNTSLETAEKPKNAKLSLREKLLKKHLGANGKLDLSKSLSFQESSLQGALRVQSPGESSLMSLERADSQRLLSELKGGAFGKEKYSETIDGRFYTGSLKFFDEKNGFGFFQIVRDAEFEDVFVYKSEFDKAEIPVEALKALKGVYGHVFSFQIASYVVHNDRRKKAINIKLL